MPHVFSIIVGDPSAIFKLSPDCLPFLQECARRTSLRNGFDNPCQNVSPARRLYPLPQAYLSFQDNPPSKKMPREDRRDVLSIIVGHPSAIFKLSPDCLPLHCLETAPSSRALGHHDPVLLASALGSPLSSSEHIVTAVVAHEIVLRWRELILNAVATGDRLGEVLHRHVLMKGLVFFPIGVVEFHARREIRYDKNLQRESLNKSEQDFCLGG